MWVWLSLALCVSVYWAAEHFLCVHMQGPQYQLTLNTMLSHFRPFYAKH